MAFLSFFAIDLEKLQQALGSGERHLEEEVIRAHKREWSQIFPAKRFAGGPTWEEGVHEWVFLRPANQPKPKKPIKIKKPGQRLGMVALVEQFGRGLGSLEHSISSGSMFRKRFIEGALKKWLAPPFSLERLFDWPLFGWLSNDFPYWGGLTRQEVAELAKQLETRARPDFGDDDLDVWADEFEELILSVRDLGTDLVTLYYL